MNEPSAISGQRSAVRSAIHVVRPFRVAHPAVSDQPSRLPVRVRGPRGLPQIQLSAVSWQKTSDKVAVAIAVVQC